MNPDETGQDQSGIKGIVMNPGLDQNLSEIGIEVTDPGLNQDQSGIRAEATSPASDRDASGIALGATAPGLNVDQSGVGRESDTRWSGIRPGQGESLVAVQSSTGSGRKGPRHIHEKHKGGAQAGCCRGESKWTTMSISRGVVVEVREKRGELRSAIPTMPFPLAVFCLVLNTFLPGMGTFVSAFAALCGAPTDQQQRHVCVGFLLNVAAALIQFLTAVVIVGWIMSIFWGMDMVILATYRMQDEKDRSTHLSMRESL